MRFEGLAKPSPQHREQTHDEWKHQPATPAHDRGHDGLRFHGGHAGRIPRGGRKFHGIFRPLSGPGERGGSAPMRIAVIDEPPVNQPIAPRRHVTRPNRVTHVRCPGTPHAPNHGHHGPRQRDLGALWAPAAAARAASRAIRSTIWSHLRREFDERRVGGRGSAPVGGEGGVRAAPIFWNWLEPLRHRVMSHPPVKGCRLTSTRLSASDMLPTKKHGLAISH